ARRRHVAGSGGGDPAFSGPLDGGGVGDPRAVGGVEAGTLEFVMSGRGDIDAYGRIGKRPEVHGSGNRGSFDLLMYEEGSNERATLTVKAGDRIYVAMRGFVDGSSATLRIRQM